MFRSVSIQNFRGFRDFKITSLERVNLITGANDVGKTALLEALYLLCGQTNAAGLVVKLEKFRGAEKFDGEPDSVAEWLWKGFFNKLDTNGIIQIKGCLQDGAEQKLEIKVVETPSARLALGGTAGSGGYSGASGVAEGPSGATVTIDTQKRLMGESTLFSAKALQVEYVDSAGVSHVHRTIIDFQGIRVQPAPLPASFPCFFLPARNRTSREEDAKSFGQLEIKKEPFDLVEVLKIVEPRLARIRSVLDAGGTTLYGDIGLGQMLPLNLLGDGLGRLTTVMLKIASAPHGIVLVDEIDNGLHYSVMEKVWRAIAKGARLFDVQVFATTHSWECIHATHRAFEASGTYDFRLHRLDRIDDEIRAVTFDRDMLETASRTDLEVR